MGNCQEVDALIAQKLRSKTAGSKQLHDKWRAVRQRILLVALERSLRIKGKRASTEFSDCWWTDPITDTIRLPDEKILPDVHCLAASFCIIGQSKVDTEHCLRPV